MIYELKKEIDDKLRYINETSELFTQGNMVNAKYKVIARDQGDTQENNNKVTDTIIIDNVPDQNMDECIDRNGDGRRGNRGSAVRCRHSTVFKY